MPFQYLSAPPPHTHTACSYVLNLKIIASDNYPEWLLGKCQEPEHSVIHQALSRRLFLEDQFW